MATHTALAACHSTDNTVDYHLASLRGTLLQLSDPSASSATVTYQLGSAAQEQLPVAGLPIHVHC